MYIVSKMICDDNAQYHVQEKPVVFSDIDKAKAYCRSDFGKNFTKKNGYDIDEVAEKEEKSFFGSLDCETPVWFLTGYFKKIRSDERMSFVEYRLDEVTGQQ